MTTSTGDGAPTLERVDDPWVDGSLHTDAGDVPRVRTILSASDRLGSMKARWGIGRMDYRVTPGLYATGNPSAESPVLVSANYKMSFDRLRAVLHGRDAWILVLDTDGINVWCAAGKGTFGTDEIVRRVQSAALDRIVSHRTLIVPQLGAPGVSAHGVRRSCGFRVVYGPVRAADLPAFLDAGLKAQPEMRRVKFDLGDRVVLIPVEMVSGGRYALLVAAGLLLLGGLSSGGYSLAGVRTIGLTGAGLVLGAFLCSAVLGPVLLPWLPGRAFSVKGAVLGLVLIGALIAGGGLTDSRLHVAAWVFMVPTIASFIVMNFTGASTYTSLSGVVREMHFAVPAQIAGAVVGFGLWLTGLFVAGGLGL
ncbi:MAG: mercury methylation corrinoid protein HgcA [Candidatus Krumholzibacteria bacterium]|nr:mercury methylation corrinoid protein HgcA [Candidatus Krumholzibacteria bacterium]